MATYHDATNLIALLHSSDIQTVRETESFLREHLQIGKDSSGLVCALVDDYIVAQDECTLSLLGLVEDPLDKDLSDRIAEHLRADSSRVHAMNLLGRLVQRQPLWLSSIFSNGLFQTLLRLLLKCDPPADLPFAISGGLLLCTLVPLSAGCLTPHLSDICSLLVRMAAAASRRSVDPPPSPSTAAPPTSVAVTAASTDDLPLLHLHATVYALFNRLYAIFPNYLLDYLRSQLKRNSREFAPLFNSIFRDLLSRVRAHPLLVAGTKDAELQAQRWRRVTSADLMLECGRYCLDLVETTAGEAGIQLAATCRQLEQQQQQAVLPEDGTFPSKESFLCSSLVRRVRTRLYTHQPGSADPYSAELAVSPIVSASASSAGGQLWLRQLQQQQRSLAHRHRKLPLPGQRRRSLSSPALLDVELASQEQQNHNQQQQQRQIRFSGKENKKAAADVDDGRAQPFNKSNESDRATEQSTDCGASSNGLQLRPPPAVLSRDSQSYAELFLSALPMFPLAKCPECGHVSAGPHLYCQPAAACSQPLPQCLSLAPADLLDAAVICSAELHQLFLEQRQIKQN
uniref:Hamartin n=1 Tax=Macrostomum lignano TaxID=282301 RepID=A0A1I8G996_9PLAT